MTRRNSFNNEEWSLLGDAPLAAAAAVAMASAGGGQREAGAMIKGWREVGERFQTELLADIVATLDPERRVSQGSPAGYAYDSIIDEALDLCAQAVALLEDRATPEEVDEYRSFVIGMGEGVARANNEAGLFGLGGEAMSRDERDNMRALAQALGYRRR